MPATHLLWDDVNEILKHVDHQDPLLAEFVDFMKSKNLCPGPPIESQIMRAFAFLASISFKPQLERYATKLFNQYDWSVIPERFRSDSEARDRWGRMALEFETAGCNPSLEAGFSVRSDRPQGDFYRSRRKYRFISAASGRSKYEQDVLPDLRRWRKQSTPTIEWPTGIRSMIGLKARSKTLSAGGASSFRNQELLDFLFLMA